MSNPTRPAVAYYRVSTQKQGQSGLGLEAQQVSVTAYAQTHGMTIVQTFTEVETGTRKRRRPELEAALEVARREGAVLLIAKLDRLSRNVAFIANLLESGVNDIKAMDMPNADRMTLQMLAVVAEKEAELISRRTREALAARKARGLPLGNSSNLTPEARAKGPQAQREAARTATQQAGAFAQTLRAQGLALGKIAATLNGAGFRTRRGTLWTAIQVKRVLDRQTDMSGS
jgi:DNA invertase Pin-like site-specific DNA recombinase